MTYGHLIAGLLLVTALFGLVVFLAVRPYYQRIDVGSPAAAVAPPVVTYGHADAASGSAGPAFYAAPQTARINYFTNGFSPAVLTIPAGTTVIFRNLSDTPFWPASDPYPADNSYPEEGTCNGRSFDACSPLPPGGTWQFRFSRQGLWGYHDNLNPGRSGMVVVR